jgi:integrase/recombinase XerD
MDNEFINKSNEVIILGNKDLTFSPQSVKVDNYKYWTRDEINDLIQEVKNPMHKMLFIFLWRSGVRITEAINLKKQDIDFRNNVMTLKWLKSRKYKYRVVPIHQTLKDVLEVFTATLNLDCLVFPISRQRAWQLTQEHMKGNPHKFRHSFAINWLRCGGDLVILHKILGHSKIQTTMEYLKIVPIDQGKELNKIYFSN